MVNYLKGIEKGVFLMMIFYFLGLIVSLFYNASPNYIGISQYQTVFNALPILLSIFGLTLGFASSINGESEDKKQEQKQ